MQVSLLVNQLRVNFTNGERVTLRVFAVNSVETSNVMSVDVIVPCELWKHLWLVLYRLLTPCYSACPV